MIPDERRNEADQADGSRAAGSRRVWVAIAVLGGIAIADMLGEGAAADWGAVYLHTSVGASLGVAALGYTVYSLGMVSIRLAGNRLLDRFTPHRLLPALSALATVTFSVGLVVNAVPVVLIGFAGLGAGLAAVIPVLFSAGRPGTWHPPGHRSRPGLGLRLGRLHVRPRPDRPSRPGNLTASRADLRARCSPR